MTTNDTMGGERKVDVLQVMDDEITSLPTMAVWAGLNADEAIRRMKEARDAVAELIDSVMAYAAAEEALANREYAGINADPHEKLQRRVHDTRRDLDSVLARLGVTP